MGRLTGNTTARNPETGAVVVLVKGDELPAWAEGLVGPHLLDEGAGATASEPATDPPAADPPAADPPPVDHDTFVIVADGKYLNDKNRFVKNRDAAVVYGTRDEAEARLADLAEKHPDASIESSNPTEEV